LLLFLLTRFASQFLLFSCVMVVQFGHEGLLVGEHLTRTLLHNRRVGGTKCGALARRNTGNHLRRARGALSSAHWGTAPRELPFEGGDPIAKCSVLGFLIAQSLGEVAGNEHEKPEQPDQHVLPPR
jgi:hypothetical protein